MSAKHPGSLRRAAYRIFRRIPPGPSHAIIRMTAPTFSVGAIALIEWDGRVLALRQSHRTGMSLPGGLVNRGEQPAQAVTREVREETGLRIDPGDVCATVFDTRARHIDVIFRVHCEAEPTVAPASEATAYDWLEPHDWDDPDTATVRILEAAEAVHRVKQIGRLLD
ncbi:NUDIX hydrolase [Leekyejoonella antrihumi]|uniref:NUDIX hydrolase n=1 Tax=Leekyejoonella antrihumi TaxID=1660198 RepID=A0A563DW94_9MICO|nr:NUDIX hydrolase [Leekyejoonella antrihumi]TWP34212.1 NUDIX hydrolase [Leekyejoonella antrihumi]